MQKHSDPLDAATDRAEQFNQQAIDNVLRNGGQAVLPFKGSCHNCGDTLEAPKRFCDDNCAEERDYVQKRLKANRPVN